ncbi:hypothetical protein [Actinomadura macrotermitis]|uniref:Uncharacterized protein n=1 Tax=Actinomadura macrotermitis TaxID=2585200 RepID=A0A7K0C919_9ACTN|nr:hypothetical protein [Actinomadura macrotermitis]MQY09886.1 hypothetical protein [Actinomadura macrotermitis]
MIRPTLAPASRRALAPLLCLAPTAALLAGCGTQGPRSAPPSPSPAPASSSSGGPCSPAAGASGIACGPGDLFAGPPDSLDKVRARLLTMKDLKSGHYQRTVNMRKETKGRNVIPGCDIRWTNVTHPGTQYVQAGFEKFWRDFPEYRANNSDNNNSRYGFHQFAILYPDEASREADFRRAWKSKCSGSSWYYKRSETTDGQWRISRLMQPYRCRNGGLCFNISDYLQRGPLLIVAMTGEGGTGTTAPPALVKEADGYRAALIKRMNGR